MVQVRRVMPSFDYLALVRSCLGLSPLRAHFLSFYVSYYSLTIILLSSSSSYLHLAVPMHKVFCADYAPRAWDPRSLQFMLNGPLY